MKTVYVLVSNGDITYYKTEAERNKHYVSQDHCYEMSVSDEEYENLEFEISFGEEWLVGSTAYLDGVAVEVVKIGNDGRVYIKKPGVAGIVWVKIGDLTF